MLVQAAIPTNQTAANQPNSALTRPVSDELASLRRQLVRNLREYARTHPNPVALPAWLLQVLRSRSAPRPDAVAQRSEAPGAELERARVAELSSVAVSNLPGPAITAAGAPPKLSPTTPTTVDPTRDFPIQASIQPHGQRDPLSQAFKNAARLFITQLSPHQDSS